MITALRTKIIQLGWSRRKNHDLRVRNYVYHVQVCVDISTFGYVRDTIVALVDVWKIFQEITRSELVNGLEPLEIEWVLVFAGCGRGAKTATNIVISDSTEQHHCFDEKDERVCVSRRVPGEHVGGSDVLGVTRHWILLQLSVLTLPVEITMSLLQIQSPRCARLKKK